jgi:DNA-binding response OmpR family regulator
MDILIADDDPISRRMIQGTLQRWGHQTTLADSGDAAWDLLQRRDAPRIAILDWVMPGMDGPQVCQAVRSRPETSGTYLLLLTVKDRKEDLVQGLDSGADDYLTKPFNKEELRARIHVGVRVVELQRVLQARVLELQEALSRVKTLEGIIPICMYCKRIRSDQNLWQQLESYISRHSCAEFSHGVCPQCWEQEVAPELAQFESGLPPE